MKKQAFSGNFHTVTGNKESPVSSITTGFLTMRKEGFEPSRPYGHWTLNLYMQRMEDSTRFNIMDDSYPTCSELIWDSRWWSAE